MPGQALAYSPYFEGGIGLPEVLHVRMGAFVHHRVSVELYGANMIFNWLVGAGATAFLFGDAKHGTPRHALIGQLSLGINPTLQPLRVEGDGAETIGAAAVAATGWAYTAPSGFVLRTYVGGVFYEDNGFAAGPHFALGAGWRF